METAKLIQRKAIERYLESQRIGYAIVDAMAPMFEKVFAHKKAPAQSLRTERAGSVGRTEEHTPSAHLPLAGI